MRHVEGQPPRAHLPGLGASAEPLAQLRRQAIPRGQRVPFDPEAARALADELSRGIEGEVRFDAGSRALYATDGSNYRQVPIGVVVPADENDVIETVATCARFGAPV